jgi:hypothetical protein
MIRPAPFLLPGLAGVLLLAGCGGAEKGAAGPEPEDAAITDALADPIMTDPDLTSQNDAQGGIAVSGPVSAALPPIDRSDSAIDAARDAAARLAGGSISAAPGAEAESLQDLRAAETAAQLAIAAKVTRGECAGEAIYTARWAAPLPGPLEVYPRGAVEEAAGSDAGGCAWRVVRFRTPVPVGDVLAFYHARLRAAGFSARHGADGDDHILRGSKGGLAYAVYARPAENGLTAADVVVGGA